METLQVIPEPAWIQAVFVCLFIVMVVYMTERHGHQQNGWQKFMSGENEKWQEFMADQNTSVTTSLDRVKDCLQQMNDSLKEHDAKVESRINASERRMLNTKKKTVSKPVAKPVDNIKSE